jgi:uncharacterized membrane protein
VSQGGGEGQRPKDKSNFRRSAEFLPSPEVLEGYNYVVDGAAARILAMFEAEQKHRHNWERGAHKVHTFSTI